MPQNLLEQLRKYTTVVADTGDFDAMEKFRPTDATTNPSLITTAAQMPQYQPIVDSVIMDAKKELGESASDKDVANLAFQGLAVAFGKKILAIVPGRVSTEVDARLSYDTEGTIAQARSIIAQYDKAKIGRDHVLEIFAPAEVLSYVVLKGSIAVDGISLTVAGVTRKGFHLWIIPHTHEVTALRERKVGDTVNLEADILAKYVEQFLSRSR